MTFGLEVVPQITSRIRFSRFLPGRQRCFTFLVFYFYWSKKLTGTPKLKYLLINGLNIYLYGCLDNLGVSITYVTI